MAGATEAFGSTNSIPRATKLTHMWIPQRFEADPDWVLEYLEFIGLATLVTPTETELQISHLPWLFDPDPGEHGALYSHFAKLNPHAHVTPTGPSVVIAQGTHAYISPRWLRSLPENPRQLPTWNYEAIHLHGELIIHQDQDWLRAHVSDLTDRFEQAMPQPWTTAETPGDFLEGMLRAIVGVELRITRVDAKQKLSQNKSPHDVNGIVDALQRLGDLDAAGAIHRANEGKEWPLQRSRA